MRNATSMRTLAADDDVMYPTATAFVLVHVACFAVVWTGVTLQAAILGISLYALRMFAITAGYHRLFSHRSFKTSRLFQFLLGFVAESSAQAGLVWWAAKHRAHHRDSDTPADVHSPRQQGFWFAHFGWIFTKRSAEADYSLVGDLTRVPELVWLDRNKFAPAMILGTACFLLGGAPGLVVGFCWSTVAVYHATFAINSLAHTLGRQRYPTGDDSRNNLWLALLTMGEGWHNNHHYFPASARQGFHWWEIDLTYYTLRGLASIGVVRQLRRPPPAIVRGEAHLSRHAIERVAEQLAAQFSREAIRRELAAFVESHPALSDRLARGQAGWTEIREEIGAAWTEWKIQHPLPTFAEVARRAQEKWAASPSLEEIVRRAQELLLESALLEPRPALAASRA